MKTPCSSIFMSIALPALLAVAAVASEGGESFEGFFKANGEDIELPFVYAFAEDGGFYDEEDPTWTLVFVSRALEADDDYDMIWDAAYLRLGITETAEFDDEPVIQVYSQSIRFSAEDSGNISGGSYPKLEITAAGPDRFAGRVYHPEIQEFFDDTFQYDLIFDVPLAEPPTVASGALAAADELEGGEPLPEGGGEAGAAFVAWCEAIHGGDFEQIKALLPAGQAAMLETDEERELFVEDLEFIQMMTPTDVEVLGGESDGETAILEVTGTFDGEAAQGAITMVLVEGRWINTEAAWQ